MLRGRSEGGEAGACGLRLRAVREGGGEGRLNGDVIGGERAARLAGV